MELLLKRDRLGQVVAGSDAQLLSSARRGDDLVAYEASSIFDCHIMFANYGVSAERVSALSLPHLAFGDLRDAGRLAREPIDVIRYIYDSKCKNLLCRELLDKNDTLCEVYANNPHYAGFTWYATRRYTELTYDGPASLQAQGDQFKVRLLLASDFGLVIKPDIVFFPEAGKAFLVKSSPMILPTALIQDPRGYPYGERPLVANRRFSLVYLALDDTGRLTLTYQDRFSLQESLEHSLLRAMSADHPTPRFQGHQSQHETPSTAVTHVQCDYTLLVPKR